MFYLFICLQRHVYIIDDDDYDDNNTFILFICCILSLLIHLLQGTFCDITVEYLFIRFFFLKTDNSNNDIVDNIIVPNFGGCVLKLLVSHLIRFMQVYAKISL